jgi:hypothetical protein
VSALRLDKRDRNGTMKVCTDCQARSGKYRLEILGQPTGRDGKHEFLCQGCAHAAELVWVGALDSVEDAA